MAQRQKCDFANFTLIFFFKLNEGDIGGVPNTAIPRKISTNTVITQKKKSGNIAIPHEGDIGVCGIAVLVNFSCGINNSRYA